MLRHKVLWDSWMSQPAAEAALVRHETRADDRFVPVTLPGIDGRARAGSGTRGRLN